MPKMVISALYDARAKVFLRPMASSNELVAIRDVTAEARNPDSMLSRFPDDFELVFVGEFDSESGAISTYDGNHNPVPIRSVCEE